MERGTPRSRGQFHHYLPRFVGRRWLQEVKRVTPPGQKTKGGRHRPREYKQELINSYDIQSDTLYMGTTDLGKTFGIVDMYKDDADSTDVYRVERAFSKLESDAARVFRVLDDAEKQGGSSVELVRSQVNTLRKFLFLTTYRNGVHSQQFLGGRFDTVTAAMVERYRVKHGLANTRAVWLRQMVLLLEDEHWEVPNDDRLLFTAAADYRTEAWNMQLELYRAPPGTEFILTENGLGLREGASTPMNILYDVISPGGAQESWFTFTRSFPITPKLAIILRSEVLTMEAQMLRDGMPAWEARRRTHASVGLVLTSYFHDIPRTMPRATYIPPFPPGSVDWMKKEPRHRTSEERKKEEDRRLRGLVNGVPLASRLQDRFIFAISDLTEDQAGKVNTLLLTHCKETISFLTPGGLLRAIEAFERDRELTTENKARYKSLKTKLLAEQARVSPSPTTSAPPSSTTISPTSQPSATASSTSDLRATMEAAPMEASLPGLRGEFKRRPVAVPHKTALARPDVPVEELPLVGSATASSRSLVATTISHPSAPTSHNDSMAAILVTPEVEAPLLAVERDLSTVRPSTSDADMPIRAFSMDPTIQKPAESSLERAADVPGDKEMDTTLCDNQGSIPGGHDSIFVDDKADSTQDDGFRTDAQQEPPDQDSRETPWWAMAAVFAASALIGGSYIHVKRRRG